MNDRVDHRRWARRVMRRLASRRRFPIRAALFGLSVWISTPAAAIGQQSMSAQITLGGILFDSTSMAPLSGAAIYLVDTNHAAATDTEGRFGMVGVPPGEYELSIMHSRINDLGYGVPPTWKVTVADSGTTVISLALPSWSTLIGAACEGQGPGEGYYSAVGIVEDEATGMPLPGATVAFFWAAGGAEVTADGDGRYWACGLPTDRTVFAQARFYGESTARTRLDVPATGVAEASFGFQFDIADESLPIEVTGQVTDQVSGDPIPDATIRLEGVGARSDVSGPEGRYRFESVEPGAYVVRVDHLGYGTHTEAVVVEGGGRFELDVGLAEGALELPGIVVTATSARDRERLARGSVVGFLPREEIARRENEARHVGDLVQGNIHALSIRENPGYGGLCIEARRERARYPACNMVMVFIDGVQIYDPAPFLTSLPPVQIENIEFVPASLAGARYGTGARFGVLLIQTRRP